MIHFQVLISVLSFLKAWYVQYTSVVMESAEQVTFFVSFMLKHLQVIIIYIIEM